MRIARAQLPGGAIAYGWVLEGAFQPLHGSPFHGQPLNELVAAGPPIALERIRLLAPCQPSKVICIGRNYVEHAAEHGVDVPTEPLIFLKPPSAVIGPDAAVMLTPLSQRVEHEAELVVVIGQQSRHLTPATALAAVLGYTCGNDVTARDLQRRDGQWSRAKGFDTFCPLGPWIETELDWRQQQVTCLVNGEVRQSGHTRDMVFGVPELLTFVSAAMTLEAGDVLMTGTPSGVSPLHAGDSMSISISGIGVLRTPVVAPWQSAGQGVASGA
jgi:2-keto-4-pentenoate hydratase/2-oxohepta-3-ene-1,7-dioic acid hydratase in catechol pathway